MDLVTSNIISACKLTLLILIVKSKTQLGLTYALLTKQGDICFSNASTRLCSTTKHTISLNLLWTNTILQVLTFVSLMLMLGSVPLHCIPLGCVCCGPTHFSMFYNTRLLLVLLCKGKYWYLTKLAVKAPDNSCSCR